MSEVDFLGKTHIEAASQAKQTPRMGHTHSRNGPEILGAGRVVMVINNETARGRDRVRT